MTPPSIHIVSWEEAEEASYFVCMRVGNPSPFTDNVFGNCSHCGFPVFFRPYGPAKPPKICLECALDLGRGGRA